MSETYILDSEGKERFFTFKNIGVSLLAGNAVLYAGNPEQWILDTELLSELLHSEAKRFGANIEEQPVPQEQPAPEAVVATISEEKQDVVE